jgi:dolichol-phosphate mannosyltransferase
VAARRTLLTGGSGFVGANLARRLLARGDDVHLFLRPGHDRWRISDLAPHAQFHDIDLGEAEAVRETVARVAPEQVFHLAAYGAYPSQNDLQSAVQTNIVATVNLAMACITAGVKAFVNAGSSSEYGLKDGPPSELDRVEPNSHYAATKASSTLMCRHLARDAGLPAVTLRLYSVYGPFEEPSRLIPTLVLTALAGRLPALAHPDIARDFIHVDDVCDAFTLVADHAGNTAGAIFNIGTGQQTSLREAVDIARRLFGVTLEPSWGSMPDRSWDTTVWVADPGSIKAELGWASRTRFEDGLRGLADWFEAESGLRRRYAGRIGLTP